MSDLIVPITVMLLRGALAVLLLAGAEALFEERLSARVRRILWVICIFLMVVPQPQLAIQPFAIDMSGYRARVLDTADANLWGLTSWLQQSFMAPFLSRYYVYIPGLSRHNYPYFIALILLIVPAVLLLLLSYLRCRKRIHCCRIVTDERINRIWHKVRGKHYYAPRLLDSGSSTQPPVLFGFFRQHLLLPVEHMQQFSDSEIELLLTHEFIHYRSGDGFINILTLALWPFCWFNLFFLAARRHLRINCELACDAEVIKRYPERIREYGNLLIKFAESQRPPETTLAFREYSGELRKRIYYILYLPQRRKSSLPVTALLIIMLTAPFLLVSAISAAPETLPASQTPASIQRSPDNARSAH